MNTEPVQLREFLRLRLEAIEKELKLLRMALNQMTKPLGNPQELDLIKLQVASLSEATHDLELRIDVLEQHNSIARWVFRQVVTIAVIVAVIWVIGLLR